MVCAVCGCGEGLSVFFFFLLGGRVDARFSKSGRLLNSIFRNVDNKIVQRKWCVYRERYSYVVRGKLSGNRMFISFILVYIIIINNSSLSILYRLMVRGVHLT